MNDYEIERWLLTAQRQMSQGQHEGAIETIRQLLSRDPDFAEAHALLALCLLNLRRLHAAQYEADLALSLAPESSAALHASGAIHLARRRFKAAEERFERWRALCPHEPAVYRSLGHLYDLTGRRQAHLEMLQKALDLDPDEPETWVDLGQASLERGDVDGAEEKALKALQIQPEYQEGLILMGHVLVHRGRLEEARDHAIWALRNDPSDQATLRLLATIKARDSLVLGLWWRYSAWMGELGDGRAILVLLAGFVLYRVGVITAEAYQHEGLAQYIQVLWLGIVAYTWIGPGLFRASLKKELATVQLDREF
jgi:Flp pilus assembly protein TadD